MKNFAFLTKIKEKFKSFNNLKNRKNLFFIIGLIVGVVSLIISFLLPQKNKAVKNEKVEISVSDYSMSIESKLQQMLLEIHQRV
jgi:hypothetical protein